MKRISFNIFWGIIVLASLYLLGNIGFDKIKENSLNEKYKNAYFWIYYNSGKNGKERLNNILLEFSNDSIANRRKELIEDINLN
jgi:hypothetical protein